MPKNKQAHEPPCCLLLASVVSIPACGGDIGVGGEEDAGTETEAEAPAPSPSETVTQVTISFLPNILRKIDSRWVSGFGLTLDEHVLDGQTIRGGSKSIVEFFRPRAQLSWRMRLVGLSHKMTYTAATSEMQEDWQRTFPGVLRDDKAADQRVQTFQLTALEVITARAFTLCAAERLKPPSSTWTSRLVVASQYLRQDVASSLSASEATTALTAHAYAYCYTVLMNLGVDTSMTRASDKNTLGRAQFAAMHKEEEGLLNLSVDGMADFTNPEWGCHYRQLDRLLCLLMWHGMFRHLLPRDAPSPCSIAEWLLTDMAAGASREGNVRTASEGTSAGAVCPALPWWTVFVGFSCPRIPHYVDAEVLDTLSRMEDVLQHTYAQVKSQRVLTLLGRYTPLFEWTQQQRHVAHRRTYSSDDEDTTVLLPSELVAAYYAFLFDPDTCARKQDALCLLLGVQIKTADMALVNWRSQAGARTPARSPMRAWHTTTYPLCMQAATMGTPGGDPTAMFSQDELMSDCAQGGAALTNTQDQTIAGVDILPTDYLADVVNPGKLWTTGICRFLSDDRQQEAAGFCDIATFATHTLEWRYLRSTAILAFMMGAEQYRAMYHGSSVFEGHSTGRQASARALAAGQRKRKTRVLETLCSEVLALCSPAAVFLDVPSPLGALETKAPLFESTTAEEEEMYGLDEGGEDDEEYGTAGGAQSWDTASTTTNTTTTTHTKSLSGEVPVSHARGRLNMPFNGLSPIVLCAPLVVPDISISEIGRQSKQDYAVAMAAAAAIARAPSNEYQRKLEDEAGNIYSDKIIPCDELYSYRMTNVTRPEDEDDYRDTSLECGAT
jgi:hypothetical protein